MAITRLFSISITVGTLISVVGGQPPALSTEVFITTTCLHPVLGEESCNIELDEGGDIFGIEWSDGTNSKLKFGDDDDFGKWDAETGQWLEPSSIGLCWNSKCLHFPFEESDELTTLECFHPRLGLQSCAVEGVAETEGLRVSWSDSSVDHFIMPGDDSDDLPSLWSNAENRWVDVDTFGSCIDKMCVLLDEEFMQAGW